MITMINFLARIVPLELYGPFCEMLITGMKAGLLILIVMLYRLVFAKAPGWSRCVLWLMVVVQLLVPFRFESSLSAYNYIPENSPVNVYYEVRTDKSEMFVDFPALPGYPDNQPAKKRNDRPTHTSDIYIPFLMSIWITGVIVLSVYFAVSLIRVKMMTRTAVCLRDNIYTGDDVDSPFVLGLFRPHIYLSSSMDESNMEYVVAHEKTHIKSGDQWWKLLGYLVMCIYWMNPLVWVSYILFCRDLELACDEKVIKHLGLEERKAYSSALLDCCMQKKMVFALPLAFGEVGVKERVKKVLNYKKPAFAAGVIAVVICVVIAVIFLTNPQEKGGNKEDNVLNETITGNNGTETSKAPVESSGAADGEIEVRIPRIDLNSTTGADGSTIYYADRHKFIFGGYYGLFVYDMDNNQIIGGVDLEPIGCNFTQGDNACEINVTEDGSLVLLHPMNNPKMYVYDVANNIMYTEEFNLDGYRLYENQYSGNEIGKYASFDDGEKIRYVAFVNDFTIGELGYTFDILSSYRRIFENTGTHSNETDNTDATNQKNDDTDSQSKMHVKVTIEDENMDVNYVERDGQYIVDGDMVFMYKMELIGKDETAEHETRFIVLTNDQSITWEQVHKSLISSDSKDWLSGTIIIGINTLD